MRSQWIPLHITQHRQIVFIGLDGKRFESPLPDMAAAFVVPMVVDSGQEVSQNSGQDVPGRVVAKRDLGGVTENLTRDSKETLLIRARG